MFVNLSRVSNNQVWAYYAFVWRSLAPYFYFMSPLFYAVGASEGLLLICLNGFNNGLFHCLPRCVDQHEGHILHFGIFKISHT